MTDLRTAAQQALAFTMRDFASLRDFEAAKAVLHDNLRAALAQGCYIAQDMTRQEYERLYPDAEEEEMSDLRIAAQQALEALELAQAYENGYKAGVAHERERCLRLIDDHVRAVDSEDVVRAIKEVQG